jgi:hypothetical protein
MRSLRCWPRPGWNTCALSVKGTVYREFVTRIVVDDYPDE